MLYFFSFFRCFALGAVALLFATSGLSHARLKSNGNLPPRNNNPGLKSGPCGGVARTDSPKEFTVGAKVMVQWEETINHPGRYEFYYSKANDQAFVLLKTVPDAQNNGIAGTAYHQYETELTMPVETCEACTIQMIQVMTENPASPSLYYSCADIKLVDPDGIPPPPMPEDPPEEETPPVVTPEPEPVKVPDPAPKPAEADATKDLGSEDAKGKSPENCEP